MKILLLLLATILLPLSARAQCTDPSGTSGEIRFNTTYDVFQGCTTRGWMAFHAPASPSAGGPAPFGFIDQTGVASGAVITSNAVTITGIGAAVAVSISGNGNPEFRIAGGAWVTNGSITDGQTLELRLTSSGSHSTIRSATVTVGTLSDQWDVATGAPAGPTGCPNIGDVCDDGTIFAGDTNMYVTDFNQSAAIQWSVEQVDTGSDSLTDGQANQAWIVANRTLSQYPAFQLCENLNRHGHTDWYLPSRNELNVLRTNRHAIGGFNTQWYWSSTEGSTSNLAWRQRFIDGIQYFTNKTNRYYVRCVRRD